MDELYYIGDVIEIFQNKQQNSTLAPVMPTTQSYLVVYWDIDHSQKWRGP